MFQLVCILVCVLNSLNTIDANEIVQLPLGKIEGSIKETNSGKSYYAFQGVPYAEAPIGDLRFEAPAPIKPWVGVRKANTLVKCLQYDHFSVGENGNYEVTGDEDCLYVNIFTPNVDNHSNLDVLVYIHGGAFMFGGSIIYGPKFLMEKNVVVVTLNYRLGPLGFLSTEDDVLPGNNGLRDQQMALQWIKDNIQYFGGNSKSVTIVGGSAGGASVQLHYLMKKSRGLFQKGMSQSGVALNSWVLLENPMEKTKKLSHILGCPTDNSKDLTDCLKRLSGRQIVQAVSNFQPWLYNPYSPFGVVVDTWSKEAILPKHPYILLKEKEVYDVPWLSNYVSAEGLYPARDFYSDELLNYIDQHWNEVMPFILHYNCSIDPHTKDSVSQQIRKHYLGEKAVDKKNYNQLVQLIGDRLFVADIEKSTRLHSAAVKSSVYSYYFYYRGQHSITEDKMNTNENFGVCHADDIAYFFDFRIDTQSDSTDYQMSQIMLDMVVSFMKTGKPNTPTEWIPVSKNVNDPYAQLRIDSPTNIKMEYKNMLGHSDFWNKLPFKENENLFNNRDEL